MSTLFSPGEQRLLGELLASDTSRLIWLLPMGMPGQVPIKWGSALLRSRALWLSAYPEDMTAATRESCLACNEWAIRLATASTSAFDVGRSMFGVPPPHLHLNVQR